MVHLLNILPKSVATWLRAVSLILLVSLSLFSTTVSAHDTVASEQIVVEEKNGQTIPLNLMFSDEQGNPVALKSLMQTPVILNLAYYTCKDICSQVFAGIAQALPKLKLAPKKDYTVITVSFDENDTPQIARETRKNYLKALDTPFPEEAWRFLTGKRERIDGLTKAVGFAFRREGNDFIHPVTLIILSPGGTINRYIYVPKSAYGAAYPVNFSALELQTSLTDAAQGKIGAAVKRIFLYCFPHEPKNQAAFFRLLSIIGAATLIGILALFFLPEKDIIEKRPGLGMNQNNTGPQEISFTAATEKYPGILGWLMSTDHKKIGIMYTIAILSFFSVGGLVGLLLRLSLIAPGKILSAQAYNEAFTIHGIIQIFLFVIPGIPVAFGNFFLPILIGARDVAFPHLNRLSWWFYLAGACIVLLSLVISGEPPDTGWTFYAPYSLQTPANISLAVCGVFILGFSSILTGLNFVTTIHRLRAPGMGWFRMPLFVWTLYATGWVQMLATPILAMTLLFIVLGRFVGVGFFDPLKGGDPILFEHLFWIYSHPAVYIMILPAMGVISEIIPVFARAKIYGYKAIVFSALAIAGVGYLVWGHHMFTSGMSDTARIVFSLITFIVAVPSGVKVFNWVATLYKGSIVITSPLLFALSFVFLFSIGGLSGLIIGSLVTNIHLHGTYFIVGHFHYVMFGGAGFSVFAALHYWFPKMTGKMYDERLAKLGWLLLFAGVNILYFPMFIIGYQGMPRRYFDYPPQYFTGHLISTVGSWIVAAGLLITFGNLVRALYKGEKAPDNPWNGNTLEWQIPSPPPRENFKRRPIIRDQGYTFDDR